MSDKANFREKKDLFSFPSWEYSDGEAGVTEIEVAGYTLSTDKR